MSLTNIGLVDHVKKALNEKWGYVYGTYGQFLTESLLQAKLKQYPDNVKQYESYIRATFLGGKDGKQPKRVADCVGLIKSFLWWKPDGPVYNSKTDLSANGMFQAAKTKGPIDTMPDMPGLWVRYNGHIGVYIGNGKVIESRGTKYGVVETDLKGRGWTHWLELPGIEYVKPVDELKEALELICKESGIDYTHWYAKAKEVKYLDVAFIKIAKVLRRN